MINIQFFNECINWGDSLNTYLVNKISPTEQVTFKTKGHRYLCIGSIIHLADDDCVVWGSGFINKNHHTIGKPKICAVRGPKTREKLISDGISCPEIYGDPALLLPRYYNPRINKKYRVGVVPHYIDKNHNWLKNKNVKIIDVQQNIEEFVKDILSCEIILSSSLHGIICADAYGIPGYWIKFNNRLGDFKFEDYMLSVGREIKPKTIRKETTIIELLSELNKPYEINIDLDKLHDSCPFKPSKCELSILVCTIPSRSRFMTNLLYRLEKQSEGKNVEILYLGDNKQMTVGEKRNKLLNMSSGRYVAFIDDDDSISNDYIDSILNGCKENKDCVLFNVEISENGSDYKLVDYNINYNDKNYADRYERMPNHIMAIKREKAISVGFPNKSFAEDHEYAKNLKKILKTQTKINKTLYYYNFDNEISQTRN